MLYGEGKVEPITQEWLARLGFERMHINPLWYGGYYRWIKDAGINRSLMITFNCSDCLRKNVPFIVWLSVGEVMSTIVALMHIKTIDQLSDLYLALTGEVLDEKR
jgi:hypothetical protein